MDKLGRRLQEAREAKGYSLEEAEAATRIRAQFIESLEAGDFAAFPGGDVQVRGFLRIYARYLDLPPDDVLGRYRSEVYGVEQLTTDGVPTDVGSKGVEPPEDLSAIRFRPRDIPVASSLPRWMNVRTVIILGVVLTILLGILALTTYLLNRPEDERLLNPLSPVLPTGLAQGATPTPTPQQPTPTFAAARDGEVTLALEATEHVQVRVSQSGVLVFQETMVPGQAETWSDDGIVSVETGNGAALRVTVNGVSMGTMCERGELCTRAWAPGGEISGP